MNKGVKSTEAPAPTPAISVENKSFLLEAIFPLQK